MAKKPEPKELGFGTLASENGQRFINHDGSANLHRIGGPKISISDLLHKLTTMKSTHFLLVIFIGYLVVNTFFATLYYLAGPQYLGIQLSHHFAKDWLECFFFSTQCLTTIGFGRVNPTGIVTNILASLEGLIGLMSFAIASGLLYGRFSRPRSQLIYSKNILYSPFQNDSHAYMFRIASTRKRSLLVENVVSVSLGINQEENGNIKRRFFNLDLQIDKISFLYLSWTIVHPVNEKSPLFGMSYEDLIRNRAEFIVLFKAIEETTSQTVLKRFSYFVDELVWNAKFTPVIGTSSDGQAVLDINRLGEFERI